jgi:hypothetical protein
VLRLGHIVGFAYEGDAVAASGLRASRGISAIARSHWGKFLAVRWEKLTLKGGL